MNNKDKILIEIAAYKDPELLNTVNSAIIQADYPERVYFSICYQNDDKSDYKILKQMKNCRIKYLKESEAKGSCYARYLCQQMIDDEKYVYQIDSHMRFVKHWDTKMIEQLLSLNDEKAFISFYPSSCTEEMMTLPLNSSVFDNPTSGGIMRVGNFREDDSPFVETKCIELSLNNKEAKRNPFVAAGNFFSFSEIHKTILHDPLMYFYGDELPMAIRYYTHGWNNYCFGESYIYHQYERKNHSLPTVDNSSKIELDRFKQLLNLDNKNIDLGEFVLGKERTIKDFEEFAGIDFSRRIISIGAETGEYEDKKLKKQISYFRQKELQEKKFLDKVENIEVIVVDLFGEYDKCIESCLNSSVNKDNISFIVGTIKEDSLSKINCDIKHIKSIINVDNDCSYSMVLSKLTKYLGNGFCTIIDSSLRFLDGWDTYLCKKIKECGSSSALTTWVWYDENEKEIIDIGPYNNIIKDFDCFYYFLPVLKYNENIDMSKRKKPYKTPFISDGFLFCNSKIIKSIKPDPDLDYEEQKYVYAARLFTNGIDLYYPNTSYVYRIKEENCLNQGKNNYATICGLLGINNIHSKYFKLNYKYGLGNKRTLWQWYEYIGFDYQKDSDFDV